MMGSHPQTPNSIVWNHLGSLGWQIVSFSRPVSMSWLPYVGRSSLKVSSAITWLRTLNCMYKVSWALSMHASLSLHSWPWVECAQLFLVPATLTSLPRWAVTWIVNQNKPFLPELFGVRTFSHSNREDTRTAIIRGKCHSRKLLLWHWPTS